MKTINTNQDIPDYFYVFLEFNGVFDKINEHNYNLNHKISSSGMATLLDKTKTFDFINGDIDYLPFVRARETNNSPSSFMMKIINEYNIEHNLEWCRRNYFKTYPSRFSGIFAFGDYHSCELVAKKYSSWNIQSVKKYRLVDLGELNIGIKVAKLNMEIVSLLRGVNILSFSIEDQNQIYNHYWRGNGNLQVYAPMTSQQNVQSEIIFEYLIEGILEEVPM